MQICTIIAIFVVMEGFNDFGALKALKKELEQEAKEQAEKQKLAADSQMAASLESYDYWPDRDSQKTKAIQGKRSHTVIHKTREQHAGEQKAREMNLTPGSIVTFMDSNDRGILRHVHKDYVEIELDGLMIKSGFRDFIVNDPEEDRELMRRSGSSKAKKEKTQTPSFSGQSKELNLDLHIDKIPGGYDAPEGFELDYQLDFFKRTLRQNLRHRGMRINVIHGVGDGILKDMVRKELDESFAISCSWAPGIAGVTVVTIR